MTYLSAEDSDAYGVHEGVDDVIRSTCWVS